MDLRMGSWLYKNLLRVKFSVDHNLLLTTASDCFGLLQSGIQETVYEPLIYGFLSTPVRVKSVLKAFVISLCFLMNNDGIRRFYQIPLSDCFTTKLERQLTLSPSKHINEVLLGSNN